MKPNPAPVSAPRILIFVVAYNARKTIEWVLDRIPPSLRNSNVEALVIDDSSPDNTFQTGVDYVSRHQDGLKITVLRNPENQGYGGNQKLGYRYAIENGFDAVALVHGDGQYAPESLPDLLAPIINGEADAVWGSRIMTEGGARLGGMPAYKLLGNQILTRFQNAMLGTQFSEFHSGYRLYSTRALRRIPFERNTNDFHFDTEIIIQLVRAGLRVRELPIPTHYGDEKCHVNGLKYAWDVCKTMIRARIHQLDLLYDRKFDVEELLERNYDLEVDYHSSHFLTLEAARAGARVLKIGSSRSNLGPELANKSCRVTCMDRQRPEGVAPADFIAWNLDAPEFPVDSSQFDQILMLGVIEHLKDPERFMEEMRFAARRQRPEVIISTPNVGFFITRLMLLCGQFNYGRRGILDRTHRRLFTFCSLQKLLEQAGYRIIEARGVPAPFPLAVKRPRLARWMIRLNEMLIRLNRGWFSYQIFYRVQALPSVHHLLEMTVESSEALKGQAASATAHQPPGGH